MCYRPTDNFITRDASASEKSISNIISHLSTTFNQLVWQTLTAAHLQLLMLWHNDDPGILIRSCANYHQLDNHHFRISNADRLNVEFGVVSGIYQVQIFIWPK